MPNFTIPFTQLIHENLSIVMTFAYSQLPLLDMKKRKFAGEWKYLDKALFEVSAGRAEKACMELALFLRMLDDEEKITGYFKATNNIPDCGKLFLKNGSQKTLTFREVANKIIHTSHLEWDFEHLTEPILISHSRTQSNENWVKAEIDIVAVAMVCGMLAS